MRKLGSRPFTRSRVSLGNLSTKKTVRDSRRVPVLLDSGSQVTVIRSESVPVIEKMVGPFKKVQGRMATASGEVDVTYLKDVHVCVDDVCATVNVISAPKLPVPVLVGTDFMTSARCSIDFRKNEMRCGKKNLKISMEG